MMRIYFCPSCGRWRMVSNRLKADCLDCGSALLLSDIPFEQWVKLDYEDRGRVADAYLRQVQAKSLPAANVGARALMEKLLGEPVLSNQPEREDTGYDY